MNIHVLALDGVFDTGLAVTLDAFSTANELAELGGRPRPFAVTIVGLEPAVRSAQGLSAPVVDAKAGPAPDWLVIPAIGCKLPEPLAAALASPQIAAATDLIRRRAAQGAKLAAPCIGAFILAESGLLDGQTATTTWWLGPMFRQRYPKVKLDDSRMVVASGDVVTAGAALSHMDLALWLVRQASPDLADLAARYLIVDNRPSQSAYVLVDHLAHADPVVGRFERWARARLDQGFSLDEAATSVGASKRTLARRIGQALGRTPLDYFQDLRVERAVHLLRTTPASVDEVAARVGYADGVTLRALLRKKLGKGVRDIRVQA